MKNGILYLISIFFLLSVSCSREFNLSEEKFPDKLKINDLQVDLEVANSQDDVLQTTKSSLTGNELPELTFKKNKKGDYWLVIKDASVNDIDSAGYGMITLSASENPKEVFSFKFQGIQRVKRIGLTRAAVIGMGGILDSPKGTIINVNIVYLSAEGKSIKSYDYRVFVFGDGTSALQRPAFKGRGPIQLTGRSNYMAVASVVIENDPAGIVAAVQVKFYEPFSGPKPEKLVYDLKKTEPKPTWNFHVWTETFRFTGDPTGFTYNTSITMLDTKGNIIDQPSSTSFSFIFGKEGSRIRKLRIKEVSDGSNNFQIGAILEDVKDKKFDYVELKFNEPFKGPKPSSILWRMRKRPEILYQAWDETLQDYISEINNNPLFVAGNDPVVNPLFFEKPAVGNTYSVTTAIYNINGKVMGDPQTFDVIVEPSEKSDEPVILSSTLTSKDKGATWDIALAIEDKGQWVEKVTYEFSKPYPGAEPLTNPLILTFSKEDSGNIKVYNFSGLKFNGDPTSFEFPVVIVFRNGSGTKNATTTTSTRPQLL